MSVTLDELVAVLEHAPLGVLLLRHGRIAWCNQMLANLSGQAKAELVGRPLSDTSLVKWQGTQIEISTTNGPRWLKCQRIKPSEEGEVLYLQDITEQVQLKETISDLRHCLRLLETTDPITGLKNRRAILRELDRQISRSRRYANPLAVIRLTLETNGSPAHQQDLMRTISQALKDKLRWADEVGVLDPCTFLVVLPETSLEDAKELTVRLLSDRLAFQLKDGEGKIQYGVAAWHKGDDLRKLLKRVQQDQEISLSALLS